MEKTRRTPGSHLFTVRLWNEVVSEDRTEWRGKVQHVLSGEVRYFRDWPTLIAFLCETSAGVSLAQPGDEPQKL